MKKRVRKMPPPLAPAKQSKFLLLQIAPNHVGTFRFMLEAYEHIAYFSVLNKYAALLKIVFSPHQEAAALTALNEIAQSLDITILPWPVLAHEQL